MATESELINPQSRNWCDNWLQLLFQGLHEHHSGSQGVARGYGIVPRWASQRNFSNNLKTEGSRE